MKKFIRVLLLTIGLLGGCMTGSPSGGAAGLHLKAGHEKPVRNVVFILSDDHRWDVMGHEGHPFVKTPHMDRLAAEGVAFKRAFVTTSLCSPSRASILTGLYAHNHGVIDNYNPVDSRLVFFPQYLQAAGFQTAFIGKWHMGGEEDSPQRGFDHWISFKGQGTYWPDGHGTSRVVPQTRYEGFNINGKRVPQKGYITDELTDYAVEWLEQRDRKKPFFLYVSHKAVHSDFVPADRHLNLYAGQAFPVPPSLEPGAQPGAGKPMWVRNQRNSRHGVDYAYNLEDFDLDETYLRYCRALQAVDENLGRLMEHLESEGILDQTLFVYMGDNGFQFGEHGLIDKRTAYEPSMRVPLLMRCPSHLPAGHQVYSMVANIDVAPTLLEAAGLEPPADLDGKSFWHLTGKNPGPIRESVLYEYFWEWNYPQTPTLHALRTEKYKYIRPHGLWDLAELYDLKADPHELNNLIADPGHREIAEELQARLFDELAGSSGDALPLRRDRGMQFEYRHKARSPQAMFPDGFFRTPEPVKQ